MANDIVKSTIKLECISPRVLGCELFNSNMSYVSGHKLPIRNVYDYELEYFLEDSGEMVVDDRLYSLSKGDIVFRRPGQITQGIMNYSCYAVYFDLVGDAFKSHQNYHLDDQYLYQKCYQNPVLDTIPIKFHASRMEKFSDLFEQMLREFIHYNESSELLLKSILLQLLYDVYHEVIDQQKFSLTPHSKKMKQIIEYITNHFHERICNQDLARICNMSLSHFYRVFSQTMNCSPNHFIINIRIDKAKEYIVKTDFTMYEIAEQCGFENVSYFSYLFKRKTGLSPHEFRKRYRYWS